jgi:hypothetical protein
MEVIEILVADSRVDHQSKGSELMFSLVVLQGHKIQGTNDRKGKP